MSSLYVLLPASPVTAQNELAYALSADGRSIDRQGSAQAALLPAASGAGSEVVLVAPAAALSWHRVELPKGAGPRSPRLRAMLEGLLEDRLLDEPETLHFALEPAPPAEGAAWVAACDRAWLRDALQLFESVQRPATRVVPEFAPEGEGVLYAVGEPDDARLVCAGAQGVFTLPLTATSLALLPSLPENTPFAAEPAVAAQAEHLLQQPPQLQPPAERLLAAARSRWDLAQLEFASTGRARTFKKLSAAWAELARAPQWRAARWGALLLVAVQLIGLNAWAWKERAALADKRTAAQALLTETFPHVRAVVDAPVQMEREVAALRQLTGAPSTRDLESLLGAVAAAVPPGRVPTGLEYNGSELRLRGLAANDGEAQPLVQALRGRGYAAALQGDTLVVRPEAQP
ncbi:type II secretion system protein GspL [Ramlibacter tataouinensis]|uniref:type II secretion system protein GspL n=1 Tax=Ramlibacter tataouinensis TaxID=94132 RepID=UPI0022F3816B|nr:type II secretion system protein GspL [Ramlibacter tataouinensis]WBY03810.1 type II secretion system protein GspL [Ramlibacter tataouinensis]